MDFEKLKEEAKKYFGSKDGGHTFDHTERVYNLALKIAKKENADLEIIKASALLHDIARAKQERKECSCHAKEGSIMAQEILQKFNFPKEKIDAVCYAIKVHRKSDDIKPETKEAAILQDADRLDALGAVNIARVIASGFTKEYERPIYSMEGKSSISYLQHEVKTLTPNSFNTKTGKLLAKKRHLFTKKYLKMFIDEWDCKD